ncbi:AI-2E family transporter [Patescibacteria group bacterium]|nr:AI-2E family transporter [Patescibacteria group bacterium]
MNEKILDISWGTIVKLAIAGFVIYLIFILKDILVWVLFGLIISILFDPVIDFLQKRKVPRVISTIGVYVVLFGILAYIIFATTPLFVKELQQFSQLLPQYYEESISPSLQGLGIGVFQDFESFLKAVGESAAENSSSVGEVLVNIFGGIFSTIFVISVAIFLSIEDKPVERVIAVLFPKKYETVALDIWAKSQKKVSGWFLSRVLSSIFVGAATYIALLLFNVNYAFSLALLSGILNFIPIVGPILTTVLVALLVALDSPVRALFVVLAITLIQQVENNILTPILSRKFIGLPPVLVLVALAIGGQFWGIMGAILAIPLAGILFEFLRDFLKKRKEEQNVVV